VCQLLTAKRLIPLRPVSVAAPSVAHSVYDGRNLADALAKFGDWSSEIVKRAAGAIGFLTPCHADGLSNGPLLAQSEPPPSKGLRGLIANATTWFAFLLCKPN